MQRRTQLRIYNEVMDHERILKESHLPLVAIADRRESRISRGPDTACRPAAELVMADDNRPYVVDASSANAASSAARRSFFIA